MLFLETLRISRKIICNLNYHNQRFNETRAKFFGSPDTINLSDIIPLTGVQDDKGYKCHIEYGERVQKVEIFPYKPKKVISLKLVEDNAIEYPYKSIDRKIFYQLLKQKGECDEIIIVKNGRITDTSISNLIFSDGSRWYTPDTPLLNGTQRRRLIDEGLIYPVKITTADLNKYISLKMINAMLPPDLSPELPINNIIL
ncbi:MAG: aminotransferase class IV [Bacteroidetes bacterium]|nr:aminotransferase class IV [Bacteroidota bacterium]